MNILVVCKHSEEEKLHDVCKIIKSENVNVSYAWKNILTEKDINGKDFVVAIGGDGTILPASHYLKNIPLLAVNPYPDSSEGALAKTNYSEVEKKIEEIKLGNHKTEILERIEVSINGIEIKTLALNDVFFGSTKSYHISKYLLKTGDSQEKQSSSGIIFSTGTGSTAWFKSAGGIPFNPDAKRIEMIVREPYQGRLNKPNLTRKTINENESVELIPLCDSILVIDSIREYNLKPNDIVKIKISKFPLARIM